METMQVVLRVRGPRDTNREEGVGVHASILIEGRTALNGLLDPDRLDAYIEAVEALTEGMTVSYVSDSESADMLREGWGLRWLEGVTYRLRKAIQADLSDAVERLTDRHAELKRFK